MATWYLPSGYVPRPRVSGLVTCAPVCTKWGGSQQDINDDQQHKPDRARYSPILFPLLALSTIAS